MLSVATAHTSLDATYNTYTLTFRCVNCGRPDIFARYLSDRAMSEFELRGHIYSVRCNSCGWKGDACGLSAVAISRKAKSLQMSAGR